MPPTCWLCRSVDCELFLAGQATAADAVDLRITDAGYGRSAPLYRCRACDFVFAHPLPAEDLVALYQDLDDPEYVAGRAYRLRQMVRLVRRISALHPGARTLLDVGAASGLLVEAATGAGIESVGVEPSRALVAEARARGIDVVEGTLPCRELAGRRFDVVACVDVIEHVSDPVALLRALRDALADGGRIVLLTPDVDSLARRLLGGRWWHFRVAHVNFLSARALDRALHEAGLRRVHRERAVWWFALSYLAARVCALLRLPQGIGVWVGSSGLLDRMLIPLNLWDSWVYVCAREEA